MTNQPVTNTKEQNIAIKKESELSYLLHNFLDKLDLHRKHPELQPKIELNENNKAIVITAEMPGVSEDDINIEIAADGYLTISGKKADHKEGTYNDSYFSEINYGMIKRSIPLPQNLEYKKAEALCDNGILQITIPKNNSDKSLRKKVNVSRKNRNKKV